MRMRKYTVMVMAAIALMAFAGPSLGETARVKATGSNLFQPSVRKIHKGDKVVWKNTAAFPHIVKAYGGGWRMNVTLNPGKTTSKRFPKKGTFKFRCTVRGHSFVSGGKCTGMCGKVVVRR